MDLITVYNCISVLWVDVPFINPQGTAWIAQLVEHQTSNLGTQGSSPCSGSMVPFVGFPSSSDVKNLPAMLDTRVWLLGREDPLEKGWLPTPVFLPGEFRGETSLVTGLQSKGLVLCHIRLSATPWTVALQTPLSIELQSMGSQRVRHYWVIKTFTFTFRALQPASDALFSSVQSLSCVRICNLIDCSMVGFPVHHQLPELTKTQVPWVCDAIQPSHPLSSLSPPTLNLSQHESFQMSQFFMSGGQSIGVSASASVLPMNIQDWFPLGWTGWISLKSMGLSRVLSNTTVQKHQFFGTQLSL